MHVTDWFTTLVAATGARLPQDRIIDGVNQLNWLTGTAGESNREGYLYRMGPELYGAKWRNFKLTLVIQKFLTDPPARLATPRLINLISDPHEREPVPLPYLHTWTATHLNKLIAQFQASTRRTRLETMGSCLPPQLRAGTRHRRGPNGRGCDRFTGCHRCTSARPICDGVRPESSSLQSEILPGTRSRSDPLGQKDRHPPPRFLPVDRNAIKP